MLGDLNSLFNTNGTIAGDNGPLSNLSWLDVKEEPNPFDGHTGNNNIVPGIQEAWGMSKASNETEFHGSEKTLDVDDLNKKAESLTKRAMMLGLTAQGTTRYIRERMEPGHIKLAYGAISKVAGANRLLGKVYGDLSAFASVDQAVRHMGESKFRKLAFVIGEPTSDALYRQKCQQYGVPTQPSVDAGLTPTLIANIKNSLVQAGLIPESLVVDSAESLVSAFDLASEQASAQDSYVAEYKDPFADAISDEQVSDFLNREEDNSAQIKELELRNNDARPILSNIQAMMLRGLAGPALVKYIDNNVSPTNRAMYASEIENLVKFSGLIGETVVNASYFKDAETAIDSVKRASAQNLHYVMSTDYHGQKIAARLASATGLKTLNSASGFDARVAADVLASYETRGRISYGSYHKLAEELSAGANPMRIVMKAANLNEEKEVVVASGMPQATPGASADIESKALDISEDNNRLATASKLAIDAGIPDSSIKTRVASEVGSLQADAIIKAAFSQCDVVPASAMSACLTQKYPLDKQACIKMSSKCNGCTRNVLGTCSAQARKFASESAGLSKKASSQEASYGDNYIVRAEVAPTVIDVSATPSPVQIQF